jgi:hypothetical protein
MPRKYKLKPLNLRSMEEILSKPRTEEEITRALKSHSSHGLDILYAEFLLRAFRREKNSCDRQEMQARLDALLSRMESRQPVIKIGPKDDPEHITLTINMFASEAEIRYELDSAISKLMFERMMLKHEHPEHFPIEPWTGQGKDTLKTLKSLQNILDWYDENHEKDIISIVSHMFGEQATKCDEEFNRKKQLAYELQRQAETCLDAAKRGSFPPVSLTRARSKRPPKKAK